MLKSLWRRLSSFGPAPGDQRALARYFRDEGLHAQLEALHAQAEGTSAVYERISYAARSYFSA